MATSSIVKTLGAGSGIDVKSLAQSLVDAEKIPQKERIDAKIAESEAKITGYGAVKYALSELKNAFAKINDARDFNSIQPSNTQPTAFGITASNTAEAGSYSIEVLQTALSQRTASSVFAQRSTHLGNANQAFTLQLSIGGGTAQSIDVNPGNPRPAPTPAAIVSAINGAKLGVTAQLIDTGSGHQIVLTGQPGHANRFEMSGTIAGVASIETDDPSDPTVPFVVNAEATASSVQAVFDDGVSLTTVALVKNNQGKWVLPDGTSRPDGSVTLSAQKPIFSQSLQVAGDASFKVNGLTVSRGSNTINDVIEGVTLDLYTPTTGAARLDLNRDTAGIKNNLKGLVSAYNDYEETLKILGDRASEVEEFGGALAGESLLQSVRNQVRALVTNTSNTPGTTIKAARDVGLTLDRFGKLNLDETKLDAALQNNFSQVTSMFTAGTSNKSIYSPAPAGLAGEAIKSLEKMLLSTGLIDTKTRNATAQIAKYQEDLKVLDKRMEMLMTRYMSQFSVMESIVGDSNSVREGLKGTFEGMAKAYGN
jgi:flagellar hook-associated protein 2